MFKLKKKNLVTLLSLMMVMTLILSGCGKKGGGGKGAEGKTDLVVAQGADPKSLDPHASNDQPSSRINKQIYETLIVVNEDMEVKPGLAKEWKQVDDNTWEFVMEEGVKFHNGEEMKASDVKFTLDRMMKSGEVGHIVGAVESVDVDGDNKVIIKTKEPFAPLLEHLAHTASGILSEKAVKDGGDDYQNSPVGTGPYKFESYDAGDKVTLARFEDYRGDAGKMEKIVFKNIPEGTNRVIGLQTGEVDIAYDVEPVDVKDVKADDKLKIEEEPSLSTSYIGFNTQKKPFDDPKVRQALNYAVDVDEIIEVVLEGGGVKATGPMNDKVFGFNKDLKGYEYNPEKAKELLKEAGHPEGFKTTIWTNDNPVRNRIAEIVQAQLKQVGVDVAIEPLEWGAYLEKTAKGEHDMFILGWVTVTGDADYGLYPLFHSSQHGGAGNRTFYTNEKVDKLLDKARGSKDRDERQKDYEEVQKIIVEEAPELFLYFQTQNAAMQKGVEGFRLHPAGHHRLDIVSVSEGK